MLKNNFPQQIEYLLFTGAIQGEEILRLYHLLKAYEQGAISAQAVQEVIDAYNPELFLNVPFDGGGLE